MDEQHKDLDQRKELPPIEWRSPFEDGSMSRNEIGSIGVRSYLSRVTRLLLLLTAFSALVNVLLWKLAGEARRRIEVAQDLEARRKTPELREFDPFLYRAQVEASNGGWTFDTDRTEALKGKTSPQAAVMPAQAMRTMGFDRYMTYVRLNGRYTDELQIFRWLSSNSGVSTREVEEHLRDYYVETVIRLIQREDFARAYRVATLGAELSRELDTKPDLISHGGRRLQLTMNRLLLLEAALENHFEFSIVPALGEHFSRMSIDQPDEYDDSVGGFSRGIETHGQKDLRAFFHALSLFRSQLFEEARIEFVAICNDSVLSKIRELACFNAARSVFWNAQRSHDKQSSDRPVVVKDLQRLLAKLQGASLKNDIEYYIDEVKRFGSKPKRR